MNSELMGDDTWTPNFVTVTNRFRSMNSHQWELVFMTFSVYERKLWPQGGSCAFSIAVHVDHAGRDARLFPSALADAALPSLSTSLIDCSAYRLIHRLAHYLLKLIGRLIILLSHLAS